MPVITLTTDFGTADGYAGILKGVILGVCPTATIVDITHDVPACDIQCGAWVLANAYPYFPQGSIHVAVVDPGVGSQRRAVILQGSAHTFVGPDNALFSLVAKEGQGQVFVLDQPQYWLPHVSRTFHGRDVFAPVAAHLASGVPAALMGTQTGVESLLLRRPKPAFEENGAMVGEIVHVDHFGNLISNIPCHALTNARVCQLADLKIPLGNTYSCAESGQPIAYGGSHGYLEIGVFQGRADVVLGCRRQARVTVK